MQPAVGATGRSPANDFYEPGYLPVAPTTARMVGNVPKWQESKEFLTYYTVFEKLNSQKLPPSCYW
jgi:hypothetical protein